MSAERICICDAQVPFVRGGAEMLRDSLRDELTRRGHEVDVVTMPYHWPTRVDVLKGCLAWRLIDLTEASRKRIDRVIATRFPSYLVKHPNKVVWLVHQLRQVYDLLGTTYSDFGDTPRDREVIAMVRDMDRRTLNEARGVFAISRNVAERLQRGNEVEAEVLYPPPRHDHRCGEFGDYVLSIGRLDIMKRHDLLIQAMKHTTTAVRCRIAGSGPEREALAELAARLGVAERVELMGWVDDREVVELFAGACGVFFAPYDEDYGYVTVEAFKAGKPVVTTADAGGVLEFVEDGVNGFVCAPDSPREIGARLDRLFLDREEARALGAAGQARVQSIGWDRVIARLIS
ncbi:MAG TPA: glycosyltransferase family 4 protein [Thermoanaerobaculia bacterium]|jgi:glycosyltransferase involved in cell wall biosynthesis|nr:glycosyltransferase family 4 protein [Thermoanaerobaculia bacterium]